MTKVHKFAIALGGVGVLSAVGTGLVYVGQTAQCLEQSWTAATPVLSAIAAIAAASAPLFAIYAKAKGQS